MKLNRIGTLILAMGFCLTAAEPAPAFAPQAIFSPLEALPHPILGPQDLVRFLKKNFKFIEDEKLFGVHDYWQTPEEFLGRRTGDCEDYALFAKFVLQSLGYEAEVVSFYGPDNYAHTIAVYKENGRFNVINEDRLYRYQSRTIEEALSKVHPLWAWGAIAEQRGTRGWIKRQLLNPEKRSGPGVRFFSKLFSKFKS